MKEITKEMMKEFKLCKAGYDMMGYQFSIKSMLSYHHLIVPRRLGGPANRQNGAILVQCTAHDYLHIIERYDYERFLKITSLLIDENILGRLDKDILLQIRDVLKSFEREYQGKTTKKGTKIVKREYVLTRANLT